MNPKEKIANIIKGRTCCVLAKGRSLEELEKRIEIFRDKDVCWVIQNKFDYIEEGILSKIGKKADLISDCATVTNVKDYETQMRLPSFIEFLQRPDKNMLMLSKLVETECFRTCDREDLLGTYQDKLVMIDDIFADPNAPKEVWAPPPNSFTLLLAFLIAGQAKKIIVFGLDGAKQGEDIFETYYKPEINKQERQLAFGDLRYGSIVSDGVDFTRRWDKILSLYKQGYNNHDVEIINCSPNSIFTQFRKINYDQLKGEL